MLPFKWRAWPTVDAAGHRLEVVAGETPVGGKALGEDQQVPAAFRPPVVVEGQEAPDVGEAVLLGRHRAPVGQGEHLAGDLPGRPVALALLALLDEVRVLGEPARVEIERHAVLAAQRRRGSNVGQRRRLPAAG